MSELSTDAQDVLDRIQGICHELRLAVRAGKKDDAAVHAKVLERELRKAEELDLCAQPAYGDARREYNAAVPQEHQEQVTTAVGEE